MAEESKVQEESSSESKIHEKELLLSEEENRYVIFPIKHDEIWKMYKAAEANFWTTEELDLSKDFNDWNKLTKNETHFIKHILSAYIL